MDREAKLAQRALRKHSALDLEAKLKEKRRIKALEAERDTLVFETFTRRNDLRKAAQDNLDRMEASLAIRPKLTRLVTLRWEIELDGLGLWCNDVSAISS